MSKRILVIDDEEVIRKSFSLALEDTGYSVETAESGMKGLEAIQKGGFDLVFLDLKMPELDGIATLRKIREVNARVPIYIVTAFHKEFFSGLQKASHEKISFELLEKPISGDKIVSVSKSILENSITSY